MVSVVRTGCSWQHKGGGCLGCLAVHRLHHLCHDGQQGRGDRFVMQGVEVLKDLDQLLQQG